MHSSKRNIAPRDTNQIYRVESSSAVSVGENRSVSACVTQKAKLTVIVVHCCTKTHLASFSYWLCAGLVMRVVAYL